MKVTAAHITWSRCIHECYHTQTGLNVHALLAHDVLAQPGWPRSWPAPQQRDCTGRSEVSGNDDLHNGSAATPPRTKLRESGQIDDEGYERERDHHVLECRGHQGVAHYREEPQHFE
jgi:hypothetical protein